MKNIIELGTYIPWIPFRTLPIISSYIDKFRIQGLQRNKSTEQGNLNFLVLLP